MKRLICICIATLLLAGCAQAPEEAADTASSAAQTSSLPQVEASEASQRSVQETEPGEESDTETGEDEAGDGSGPSEVDDQQEAEEEEEEKAASDQPATDYEIVEFFDFLFVYNTASTLTKVDSATAAVYFESPDCFAVVQYMGASDAAALTQAAAEEVLGTIKRSLDAVYAVTEYSGLTAMTVAGQNAYRVSARLEEVAGGEAQIQSQTFFVLDGSFYNIGYTAPEEKYSRYLGAYSDMLGSAVSIAELEAQAAE